MELDWLVDKIIGDRDRNVLIEISVSDNCLRKSSTLLDCVRLTCSKFYVCSINILLVLDFNLHLTRSNVSELHSVSSIASYVDTWLNSMDVDIIKLCIYSMCWLECNVIVRSYSTCRVTSLILCLKSICNIRSGSTVSSCTECLYAIECALCSNTCSSNV